MKRLTNSEKEIPTLVDNAEYWIKVYFKLKEYEDLELKNLEGLEMRDKIKEIAIKTIKTMCETAVGCIGSSVVLSDVSWKYVISASILSGITTILINISQLKE